MSTSSRHGLLAVLLTLLPACPAASDEGSDDVGDTGSTEAESTESGSTESSSTESSSTETGSQPLEGCECIVDQDDDDPPLYPTCDAAMLCPTIELVDDMPAEYTIKIANPEALDCALAAMRDRSVGLVTWTEEYNVGIDEEAGYWMIQAGDQANYRRWGRHDLDLFATDATRVELQPPAYYEGCLAKAEPIARYDCLIAAINPPLVVCDEKWNYTVN